MRLARFTASPTTPYSTRLSGPISPRHDLAGMNTHADGERWKVLEPQLSIQALEALDDSERRTHGSIGVIRTACGAPNKAITPSPVNCLTTPLRPPPPPPPR